MNKWSVWGIVIALVCLAVIGPTSVTNATMLPSTMATAYHINAQHSGLQTDTLVPSLSHKWTKTLGGTASYSLMLRITHGMGRL